MNWHVTNQFTLREEDLHFDFVRASGPGGQNVNKVATAAQLRYDTSGLPESWRSRALKLAGSKATREGVIVIEAKRYRTQERNRDDAVERLIGLLRKAAHEPRPRKKTRVSPAKKKKRVEAKRQHGRRKQLRKMPPGD
jgi:ribosome-associated protein